MLKSMVPSTRIALKRTSKQEGLADRELVVARDELPLAMSPFAAPCRSREFGGLDWGLEVGFVW